MSEQVKEQWVTVHVMCPVHNTPPAEAARTRDALDAMGALLAENSRVGGVETVERAAEGETGLVVYTDPGGRQEMEQRARELAASLGLSARMYSEEHEGSNWREEWKRFFQPIAFGDGTLLLRPSWIDRRPHDPPLEVVLDPGRAFGTGQHESTRICLESLVAFSRERAPVERVLDLGCGSGILGLAAARLFDRAHVTCIDIDPEACEFARANVAQNDLSDRVDVIVGELEQAPEGPFDLIAANIRPEVLMPLASDLVTHLSPSGRAVLSGVLTEESDEVRAAYVATGAMVSTGRVETEWTGLVVRRETRDG